MRTDSPVAHSHARATDPLPPAHLAWPADLAIRIALALMPFSAIVWTFVAR